MNPFEFDDLPPPSAPKPAKRSRSLAMLSVAAIVVVALSAAGLYLATRDRDSGPPPPPPQSVAVLAPVTTVHRTEPTTARPGPSVPAPDSPAERPEGPDEKFPPKFRKGPRPMTDKQKAVLDNILRILNAPDRLTVYALHPYPPEREHPRAQFHEWKVLGQVPVHYPAARETVVATVESFGNNMGAKCFNPRHGVHAEVGSETVDLVICFECFWVYVYFGGDDDARGAVFTLSRAQSDALEKLLTDGGVRRPRLLDKWEWENAEPDRAPDRGGGK